MDSPIYPTQIIVKSAIRDTSGDYGPRLKIIDSEGKPYSVNEKHKALWPVFENNIGKAVLLQWNTFQGKTYIDGAQVLITAPSQQATPATPAPTMTMRTPQAIWPVVTPTVPVFSREGSIEAQVAFKGAVELISNKCMAMDSVIGLKAQAWMIEKLDAAISDASQALIRQKIESMKEAVKPKKAAA